MTTFERYSAYVKLAIKDMFVYRFDMLMWSAAIPLFLLVMYSMWSAVYEYAGVAVIRGFTFQQMIIYYILNMVVWGIVDTNVDKWTSQKIIDGTMIKDLTKPFGYAAHWFTRNIGYAGLAVVLTDTPLLIIGALFFGLKVHSIVHTVLFLVSLALAYTLNFILTFNFGITSFWLKRFGGMSQIRANIVSFLSGAVIPISFFPASVVAVLKYLPFQYIVFGPIQIFLGNYSLGESLQVILIQSAWIAGLYVLYKIFWNYALKQFSGVGA